MKSLRSFCLAVLFPLVLLTTSCGGGGGGGNSASVTPIGPYTVGGSVSGLRANDEVVVSDGVDTLSISANGVFTFPTPLATNSVFAVQVSSAPVGETCKVLNGQGTVTSANVVSVTVACAKPRSVYVANAVGGVYQYSIGSTGGLTPMSVPSVPAGSSLSSIAVDPVGRAVYVTDRQSSSIFQFSIGPSGALTPLSVPSVQTGLHPSSIAIAPSGTFAYASNFDDNTISQFSIGTGGALTPLNPAVVRAVNGPARLYVDHSGHNVYSLDLNAGTVAQFVIGANGTLTPQPPSTITLNNPGDITTDRTGSFAYIVSQGNGLTSSVSQFAVAADGSLAALQPPSVSAFDLLSSIITSADGKFVYVASDLTSKDVQEFAVGASGTLSPIVDAGFTGNGFNTVSLALDPSGTSLYLLYATNIARYNFASNGNLLLIAGASVQTGLQSVGFVVSY